MDENRGGCASRLVRALDQPAFQWLAGTSSVRATLFRKGRFLFVSVVTPTEHETAYSVNGSKMLVCGQVHSRCASVSRRGSQLDRPRPALTRPLRPVAPTPFQWEMVGQTIFPRTHNCIMDERVSKATHELRKGVERARHPQSRTTLL